VSNVIAKTLRSVLYRIGYRLEGLDRLFDFEAFLHLLLRDKEAIFFVQIGACDGVSSDPIHRFVRRHHDRVAGLVVEPLDDHFEDLQRSYAPYPAIVPVHGAIHNSEKQMILHRVDPRKLDTLPKWTRGISSFDKDHHKRSGTPSEVMIEEMVPCRTLDEVLEEHGVRNVDVLVIDTEGYDAEILRGFDFRRFKPKIIRFEHGLSSAVMSRETFSGVVDLLHRNNYELALERFDATAYQRDLVLGS
jgi:FkbM family methyltransferase